MAAPGGFKKKEVDIEALMAMAAAAEEEAKQEALKPTKKKKPKKEKVKKERVKKPKKEKVKKERKKKESTKDVKKTKGKKKSKKKGNEERNIFGVPINELVLEEDELPEVFEDLITCLEGHATETEGLFRKTAPVSSIDALIDRYHSGEDIDWNEIEDKHVVGGVLMAFLLRLPEPLITFSAYDKLMNICSSEKTREEQLTEFKDVILDLPDLNYNMLEYLFDFLDTMTRDSDGNLMTSNNLAICFGPGLLRRQEENLGQLMKESGLVTSIVESLIDQYGFFFREEALDEGESNGDKEKESVDYTAFITVALKGLTIVSKKLVEITGELEWDKIWPEKSLAYLSILENLLSKIISSSITSISNDDINQEVSKSLSGYISKVQKDSISTYCKDMRTKLLKHRAAIEDIIVLLNQESKEKSSILSSCKMSKCSTVLFKFILPHLITEKNTSTTNLADVKVIVPNIKKELNQLKVQLDSCSNYHFAVVLSRVIRAIQKGLKERSKTPILDTDLSIPTTTPTAKDKLKIENLQDAIEFSFPVCIKILNTILKELDDPSKKEEATKSSEILTEVNNVLTKFRALKLSPSLSASASLNSNNAAKPIAAHPKTRGAPQPIAPHPRTKSPTPIAPHPKTRGAPQPVAPHPKTKSPTPIAPHPKTRGAPQPVAPHPKTRGAPQPVAPHPKTRGAPQPVAPHPKTRGGVPPPVAPHPRTNSPTPIAPHPKSTGRR